MKIQIESKILINRSHEISQFSKELFESEFKISRNSDGDLNIVRFENINVELIYNDRIHDRYSAKLKGEVKLRTVDKKRHLADNITISNKKLHINGQEETKIDLSKISYIDFFETYIDVITAKKKYQISTKSFKLNVYLITMLEWIVANDINDSFEGKKIKFTVAKNN